MNMTQLITKSSDWKEVNKHILLAFVKGFYYLDEEEDKIVYVPSYKVGLEHHTFSKELYEDENCTGTRIDTNGNYTPTESLMFF